VPAADRLRQEVSSLSMVRALPATSRRAACPAIASRRQDVHQPDVHHPADRQAGARPVPLSGLPALRVLALRPRAACRGVLRELRSLALSVLRPPGRASAACARDLRRPAVCPGVAVLRQAAAGSASDVRARRPVAVASQASRAPPQAAQAVQVPAPASRQAARAVRVRLPAEAVPGARRVVRAVPELSAEQGVRERPRAAEAERGAQVLPRAEPAASDAAEQRPVAEVAGLDARALRPAAEPDAARLLEAALDARERPARAVASAFRQVRALPLAAPVQRPAAKFVRATLRWRTASPSAQSWQAARDEALS